jgi:hypothetical protein
VASYHVTHADIRPFPRQYDDKKEHHSTRPNIWVPNLSRSTSADESGGESVNLPWAYGTPNPTAWAKRSCIAPEAVSEP